MVNEDIYNLITQQISPENINKISSFLGLPIQSTIIIIAAAMMVLLIWSLIWKGLALWKSAKLNHKAWFVIILIVNSVGILEILYIYYFSKIDWNKKKSSKKKKVK